MSSVNKVIILGHLGADPETRTFNNGGKVCNLRVATSESWKDKATGERKEKTEWHSVSILSEGLAGIAERYLKKGSKVYLSGKLQTRKWQDKDGSDRYSTEILLQGFGAELVLLDAPSGDRQSNARPDNRSSQRVAADHAWGNDDLDSDVPF